MPESWRAIRRQRLVDWRPADLQHAVLPDDLRRNDGRSYNQLISRSGGHAGCHSFCNETAERWPGSGGAAISPFAIIAGGASARGCRARRTPALRATSRWRRYPLRCPFGVDCACPPRRPRGAALAGSSSCPRGQGKEPTTPGVLWCTRQCGPASARHRAPESAMVSSSSAAMLSITSPTPRSPASASP